MTTVREQLETIESFQSRFPVDVLGLIKALGIDYAESVLHPNIAGMIERADGDGYRIAVNYRDPRTRQRFTAAHELGHFMLHRPRIGDGVDDDRLYRSTPDGKYYNTAIGRREETQANRFAANLLMPADLIEDRKNEWLAVMRRDHVDREIANHMADDFRVSQHAMCIRLGVPYE